MLLKTYLSIVLLFVLLFYSFFIMQNISKCYIIREEFAVKYLIGEIAHNYTIEIFFQKSVMRIEDKSGNHVENDHLSVIRKSDF